MGSTSPLIIRAMLRQAPNVILVGEMRDYETAIDGNSGIFNWTLGFQYTTYERCARCRYTYGRHGCARLPGRRQRDRHHGATAGAGRSARKCKQPYTPSRRRAARPPASRPSMAAEATFMKGRGCSHCGKSGYRGRLGVFELMTDDLQASASWRSKAPRPRRSAKAGRKGRHDNALRRRHPEGAARASRPSKRCSALPRSRPEPTDRLDGRPYGWWRKGAWFRVGDGYPRCGSRSGRGGVAGGA